MLEELVADSKQATPDDLLTLAQFNELDKNLPAAKELFVRLASQDKADAASLARLADFLLRNGELDEAETWLGRLESAAPDNFTVLQLRSQWLKLKNRGDEIVPLVDAYKQKQLTTLPSPNRRNGMLQNCAALYAATGNIKAAEATYRELYAADPLYYAILADWLFSQKKTREAVELIAAAAAKDSTVQPALQLARLMLK